MIGARDLSEGISLVPKPDGQTQKIASCILGNGTVRARKYAGRDRTSEDGVKCECL